MVKNSASHKHRMIQRTIEQWVEYNTPSPWTFTVKLEEFYGPYKVDALITYYKGLGKMRGYYHTIVEVQHNLSNQEYQDKMSKLMRMEKSKSGHLRIIVIPEDEIGSDIDSMLDDVGRYLELGVPW